MNNNSGKSGAGTYEFPRTCETFKQQFGSGEIDVIFVDSLMAFAYLGIVPKSFLIYRLTTENDEKRLSVWRLKENNNLQIGFASDDFGDISFHSETGLVSRYDKSEVEMLGIIVGIVLPFDAEEIKTQGKASFFCQNCEAWCYSSLAGIRAQGWQFAMEAILCPNCR